MLRRNSRFENRPKLGDCRSLPMSGINRERSTYNNQLEQSLAVTCTFHEKEGARASCQRVTLCNCGGLPASTTTVKNAIPKVGTPRPMLKTSPPWLHRHGTPPRTGNGMPIDPPSSPTLKAALYYWRGIFRSWPFTTEGVLQNVFAHVASYHDLTKSVAKASSSATVTFPRLWELSPVREGTDGATLNPIHPKPLNT